MTTSPQMNYSVTSFHNDSYPWVEISFEGKPCVYQRDEVTTDDHLLIVFNNCNLFITRPITAKEITIVADHVVVLTSLTATENRVHILATNKLILLGARVQGKEGFNLYSKDEPLCLPIIPEREDYLVKAIDDAINKQDDEEAFNLLGEIHLAVTDPDHFDKDEEVEINYRKAAEFFDIHPSRN
ncbi:MAG: hypothetical protein ACK5MA_00780 [Parachlamydiaceae bacterium]